MSVPSNSGEEEDPSCTCRYCSIQSNKRSMVTIHGKQAEHGPDPWNTDCLPVRKSMCGGSFPILYNARASEPLGSARQFSVARIALGGLATLCHPCPSALGLASWLSALASWLLHPVPVSATSGLTTSCSSFPFGCLCARNDTYPSEPTC